MKLFLACGLLGLLAIANACTANQTGNSRWVQSRIADYEADAPDKMLCGGGPCGTPLAIWRMTYRGKIAYYFVSGCHSADGYNTLFDEAGTEICSPSGGNSGNGRGDCPKPMEQGSNPVLIWVCPSVRQSREHSDLPQGQEVPPRW